jgi:hypothetical protein
MDDNTEVENIVPESALSFLQAVYRSSLVPLHTRMRAAAQALPFETPKLSAMAISSMDQHSFAAALDRAIARTNAQSRVIEHRSDEGRD